MEFARASAYASRRYDDFVATAAAAVLCLDFDGTLAPIVEDPRQAHIHPDAPDLLLALTRQVRAVAVITGRPVRQAVSLGDLDSVGARAVEEGNDLLVLGQYGNERWSAREPRVSSPRPPRGLAGLLLELPDALRRAGLADAHVESKGLSVAVHTRRMDDPDDAEQRLRPVLQRLAVRHQMTVEPGRYVVEVRAPGMDKGAAVRSLKRSQHADAMMFVGDDLGDVEAFDAIADLRRGGMVGVLVCSGSDEEHVLKERSDFVVEGPDGVMRFLEQLMTDLTR